METEELGAESHPSLAGTSVCVKESLSSLCSSLCAHIPRAHGFNLDPLCLPPSQGTFIFSIVKYSPLKFSGTYVYPLWANILGWFIASISLFLIPLFVFCKLIQGEGTLRQVRTTSLFDGNSK